MGKIETLKQQYPKYSNELSIAENTDLPPKYLNWFVGNLSSVKASDLIDLAFQFDKALQSKKIDKFIKGKKISVQVKDIGWWQKEVTGLPKKYKSSSPVETMRKFLGDVLQVKSRKEMKNADVLFEDDRFLVIAPRNFDAVKLYGANTQWCIVDECEFHEYIDNMDCTFIFIIDKDPLVKNERYGKLAVHKKGERINGIYFADDDSVYRYKKALKPEILSIIEEYTNPIIPEREKGVFWSGDVVRFKKPIMNKIIADYKIFLQIKDNPLKKIVNGLLNNNTIAGILFSEGMVKCPTAKELNTIIENTEFKCQCGKYHDISFPKMGRNITKILKSVYICYGCQDNIELVTPTTINVNSKVWCD